MAEDPAGWRAVARLSELPEGLSDVSIGRHLVLLLREGDRVRAYQGLCPHQFARLADGLLIDGALQCPHHLARFDLEDGRCGAGWVLPPLKRYAARIEDGAVLLPDPLTPL